MVRLILASSSPQRKRLLHQAGYQFEAFSPSLQAECGVCSGESPPELVARLAFQKAADVARRLGFEAPNPMASDGGLSEPHSNRAESSPSALASSDDLVILGCDTVAECVGHILGKPSDADHAKQMLELLSGRVQHVYSGVCLIREPAREPHVRVAVTRLRMDALTSAQIDEYVASGAWEGKAGGFGYQDRVGWLHIEDGSESNVIGLPLELVSEMLTTLKPAAPDA